jgi:hypothetical protein
MPSQPPPDPDDRWPSFYLLGAEKAGTTSLYHYLRQHPDVFLPEEKEPGFFSLYWDIAVEPAKTVERTWGSSVDLDRFDGFEDALAVYRSLYQGAPADAERGDCTASYLWHPRTPERIETLTPEARFLVLVRDPVERAFSHYLMVRRAGAEERAFLDALERDLEREGTEEAPHRYLLSGRYTEQIERYTDRFGSENVHVVFTERMAKSTDAVLHDVARFLGLPTRPIDRMDTGERHNPYREPANALADWLRTNDTIKSLAQALLPKSVRDVLGNEVLMQAEDKPTMSDEARASLEDHYAEEPDRLEALVGKRPPWSWA